MESKNIKHFGNKEHKIIFGDAIQPDTTVQGAEERRKLRLSNLMQYKKEVIGLADMLLCDSCGAFPNKNRTGSCWECGCGNLKLNPLQRPR